MIIKKKIWLESFQEIFDGKKKFELRLADFDLKEGDMLILEEYNPKTKQYTGRKLIKRVKNLSKVKLTDFNPVDEIIKFGHYIIELE